MIKTKQKQGSEKRKNWKRVLGNDSLENTTIRWDRTYEVCFSSILMSGRWNEEENETKGRKRVKEEQETIFV